MDIKVPSRICWTNLQCCSPVCQYTESTSTASVHCSVPKPHMIPNFRMSRDAFHIIIKCMLTWAPTRSHPSASSWMMSQLQLIYKTLTTLTYNHTHTQTIQTIILHTRTRKDINLRPKDGRPQFLNFKLAISSIGLFNELENVTRERTIDFIQFYELIELTAKRSPIFSVADDCYCDAISEIVYKNHHRTYMKRPVISRTNIFKRTRLITDSHMYVVCTWKWCVLRKWWRANQVKVILRTHLLLSALSHSGDQSCEWWRQASTKN